MKWRRRNFLINKDFQLRFIIRTLFGILIMALFVAFTAYYTTWVRIMDQFYNIPPVASQFAPLFFSVNRTLVFLLFLFLLVAALLSVFISHTIAGPMYRFEQTLKALREGDLTQHIELRRSDEFTSMVDLFNTLSSQWREEVVRNRKLVEDAMEAAKKGAGGKTAKGSEIQAALAKLKDSWRKYKTE
ncbi:MAG: HAMP domain-containing protein [candidate division FCPU426 bacterium]